MNRIPNLLGWNIYPGWYPDWGPKENFGPLLDQHRHDSLAGGFCVSEYGAGASVEHHESAPRQPKADGQWHPEEWQALVHETAWAAMKQRPFVWGTFVWNMFDFASDGRSEGELSGRNDKGLVTYDRKVKKDAFYWYKAHWNPEPMVHIASKRFTPRPAGSTTVTVYSNCDSLQLTINGKSLGTLNSREMRFVWSDVDLRPGENILKAHGRKDGIEVDDTCTWVTVGH
jgi:beta-galactosidase